MQYLRDLDYHLETLLKMSKRNIINVHNFKMQSSEKHTSEKSKKNDYEALTYYRLIWITLSCMRERMPMIITANTGIYVQSFLMDISSNWLISSQMKYYSL